jgi:GNAT superfamily N-acetyltransferase
MGRMARKTASPPADPNRLVRQQAGTYRSEDGRFTVREGGTGWFLTDSEQSNEFGQELVLGPYATLGAVRETLPEARRTTIKPLPTPTRTAARGGGDSTKTARGSRSRRSSAPAKPPEHRLVKLLRDAGRGRFPPSDLGVEVIGPPPGPCDAVVAFSGHNVVAAGIDPDELRTHLPSDDPGGPLSAPFLTWLALQLGTPPGSLDVVLVADGTGVVDPQRPLHPVEKPPDWVADRVERARAHRSAVRVFADADEQGIVIVGRGLAERREVSLEVGPGRRGRGIGTALARAARGLVVEGEPLFAQVAPGNAASLRAFLRAGYRPIGAEVLFLRRPEGGG